MRLPVPPLATDCGLPSPAFTVNQSLGNGNRHSDGSSMSQPRSCASAEACSRRASTPGSAIGPVPGKVPGPMPNMSSAFWNGQPSPVRPFSTQASRLVITRLMRSPAMISAQVVGPLLSVQLSTAGGTFLSGDALKSWL